MMHSQSYRRILQKMDYYNYQRGLIFHHLDEEGGWNNHLSNCRNFILRAYDFYRPSKITVLGSGWLLDLPIKEMYEDVSEINLVDIIHPPEVKNQTSELKKVILREDDITGGLIDEIWQKAGKTTFFNKLDSLDSIQITRYNPQFDPGLVISLNILTQLEVLPVKFLKKKTKADDESLLQFRKKIQAEHISFLKQHNSVLITDISEIIKEKTGNVIEKPSVLVDLPDSKFQEDWTWNFENRKSDFYNKKSVFKVSALAF